MKNFIKKAGLQIGVFALAISGAFASNALNTSQANQLVEAFLPSEVLGRVCNVKDACLTQGIVLCTWYDPSTSITHRLYGMEKVGNQILCTKTLYRR